MNVFKNFIGMFLLKKESYLEASKGGFGILLLNILIGGLGYIIGDFLLSLLFPSSTAGTFATFNSILPSTLALPSLYVVYFFFYLIMATGGLFIGAGILHLVAKLFGGKGKFMSYAATLSHCNILYLVMIVPFLGQLVAILGSFWSIVVAIFATMHVQKLSGGKATATILIPYAIAMILAFVLMILFIILGVVAGIAAAA